MTSYIMTLTLTIQKQPNQLDGITCYEPADADLIKIFLQTDLLKNNFKNPFTREMIGCEAKQLKRYNSLIKNGLAIVEYNRPAGMYFGRSNPKASVGMFGMRKLLRHSLAIGLVDWDIVNCHPDILLQICKANNMPCDKLEHYVKNRDTIIAMIMEAGGCSRDRVKELFISLLYFGTFEYWLKETKDPKGVIIYEEIDIYKFSGRTELLDYITGFTEQMKNIGKMIELANSKLCKEVDKNNLKKKKKGNRLGSVVSFYLQEWEIRILECIYSYCKERGYINQIVVLCADGLMLEEALIEGRDIATEFNAIVKEKLGLNMRFAPKALDERLTKEEIEKHLLKPSSLDTTKFQKFDISYFKTLEGYARRTIYFEIFVTKVMRPDPAYVYIETEGGLEEMNFYSQGKIIETFNHLKTGEFHSNGEDEKFITKWLADETLRCYNKMDFIPFNDKTIIPPHIFNLFRGFSDKCKSEYDYGKREKILKPFMDLGVQLCGGNEDHFRYLLKYLADIIQNPNRKNPIAFIIKGKQGTGKNVFLNAIGNVIGKEHYITSSNPKDFFGDYAEGFYHKLLVNMNECEGKDTFDFEGRIKSFITEDTITLNRKFVQPITIANLARLIIFSNKPNPIPIDVRSKDRRYTIYETTDKYLDPKYGTQFWMQLVGHFNRPEFIACLYDCLNELDLTNTDWRVERPITKAYMDMCRLYIPTEVLFLENKICKALTAEAGLEINITGRWDTNGIEGQELYKEYTAFAKEFGFYKEGATYQKNIKCFYAKIGELELPIILKKPNNLYTYYFKTAEVLKTMKDRKWIDRSDDDYNEDTIAEVKGEDFSEYFDI